MVSTAMTSAEMITVRGRAAVARLIDGIGPRRELVGSEAEDGEDGEDGVGTCGSVGTT